MSIYTARDSHGNRRDIKAPDDPSALYRLLSGLLVSMLLFPLRAVAYITAADAIWNWFVAPQYGDGPGRAAWFGMFVLAMLVKYEHPDNTPEEESRLRRHPVVTMIARAVLELGVLLITVLLASLVGMIFGWK